MKTRLYGSYAVRSLARGGQRTLLAVFCVAVGVLAIVAIQLAINAIDAGVSANARQINGGDIAIVSKGVPFGAPQLTVLDRLKARGTITAYSPVNDEGVWGGAVATHMGLLVVDPARFPLAGGAVVTAPAGGHLAALLYGTTVVVSTHLAQRLNLTLGSRVPISASDGRAGTVQVGGIVASTGVLQGSLMLIARDAYVRLPGALGQPLTYNTLYVDVPSHSDARAARVAALLRHAFPPAAFTTTQQTWQGYRTQIARGRTFVQIVGLLALLIGGVGIMNTMQVALRRRRTEIAMLKAMGYRRRDLYALFGLEAALLGLAGGVLGTAAGSALSVLIKGAMENLFTIVWPTTFDARTLVGGVALGAGTALIFGLWPIVQASELRPQVVLRGLSEDAGRTSRALSVALGALLVLLFVGLGASIVGNVLTALVAIAGIGLALGVLSLLCAGAVVALGALRLPTGARRGGSDSGNGSGLSGGPTQGPPLAGRGLGGRTLLLAGGGLLLAAGLAVAVPATGVPLLLAVGLGGLVLLLPWRWRWAVKLALRRIGRQRARTVGTLLALCIGVFAIGLVLTLDQDIQAVIAQQYMRHDVNVSIAVTGRSNRDLVQRQLAQTPGMTNEVTAMVGHVQPLALAGRPFGALVRAAVATGKYQAGDLLDLLGGVQGYDLAGHQRPDPHHITLVRGAHDRHVGRTLTAADAGTPNALLLAATSRPPLNLRLGDTVRVADLTTRTPLTLRIVGFYTADFAAAQILVDDGVVSRLANGRPLYLFGAYLPPDTANATLYRIQHAVPAAQAYSLNDFDTIAQVTSILGNVTLVLTAIASLALLAAIVLIANTVALALLERRRELGILKAVGYTSRGVLGTVLLENGAIGVTGALVAMLLVAAATPLLGQVMYNQPFGVPLPITLAAIPITAAVCMALAAAIAWSATRVRPLDVLRYE